MKQRYFANQGCIVTVTDRQTGEVLTYDPPHGSRFTLDEFGHPGRCDFDLLNATRIVQNAATRQTSIAAEGYADTAADQTYLPSPAKQHERLVAQITQRVLHDQRVIDQRKRQEAAMQSQQGLMQANVAREKLDADAKGAERKPGEDRVKGNVPTDDPQQLPPPEPVRVTKDAAASAHETE